MLKNGGKRAIFIFGLLSLFPRLSVWKQLGGEKEYHQGTNTNQGGQTGGKIAFLSHSTKIPTIPKRMATEPRQLSDKSIKKGCGNPKGKGEKESHGRETPHRRNRFKGKKNRTLIILIISLA